MTSLRVLKKSMMALKSNVTSKLNDLQFNITEFDINTFFQVDALDLSKSGQQSQFFHRVIEENEDLMSLENAIY